MSAPVAARPRLGFAGVGWIGRSRLEAVVRAGCAEVAAVAEPDPEALAAAATWLDGAARVDSFAALLREDLDGLVVATPTALHGEQVAAALDRGLAVFCQKPLGRTAAEVAGLVDRARNRDLLLGVDMSYRHTAAMQAVKRAVAEGRLGRVHSARAVFHNAYGPDKAWYRDPRLAGGGCLMDLGVHLVDLLLWVLAPSEVERVTARLRPAPGQEEHALCLLDLAGGGVAEVECSWNLHAGRDAVIEVALHGTEGGAAFLNVGGSFYDFRAELYRGTGAESLAEGPDPWFGRAAAAWAGRLAEGAGFDPDIAHLVAVADVLDRAYRA